MKKTKLIMFVLGIAFILSSCETLKEPKIEYSPVYPLSGEWIVRFINPLTADTTGYLTVTTFNDANNSTDSLWIRKTGTSRKNDTTEQILVRSFTAKASCSLTQKTFIAPNVQNRVLSKGVSVGTCKVTEGAVVTDGWDTNTGHKADKITFKYEDSRFAGIVYTAEGYRRTGWPEDEPH